MQISCAPEGVILKKQQGFTLIELVVVIVILGVLAVTAAPKFIDLTSDAKRASRAALFGSIKSASQMAHLKCITDSSCDVSGDSTIEVGGNTIRMDDGYPSANHGLNGSIRDVVEAGDWEIRQDSNKVVWRYPGTTAGSSDCTIAYIWAGGSGAPTFPDNVNDDTCS
jgi:MSHA pilin protein MshA